MLLGRIWLPDEGPMDLWSGAELHQHQHIDRLCLAYGNGLKADIRLGSVSKLIVL